MAAARPDRSWRSTESHLSAHSHQSIGSAGSVLSIGSAGSILAIGSAGSILSIGSAGSILSIGSAGRVLGPSGQHRHEPHLRIERAAGLLAVAALLAALRGQGRSGRAA